jgi:hypothetical protein
MSARAGPESRNPDHASDTIQTNQLKGWKPLVTSVGPALILPLADPIMSAMDLCTFRQVRNDVLEDPSQFFSTGVFDSTLNRASILQ